MTLVKKVLVVDDDADTVEIISIVLSQEGFDVLKSELNNVVKEVHQFQPGIV